MGASIKNMFWFYWIQPILVQETFFTTVNILKPMGLWLAIKNYLAYWGLTVMYRFVNSLRIDNVS